MRQRKAKNLEQRLTQLSTWLVEDAKAYKGTWRSLFGTQAPLFLEVGCGKGAFLEQQAKRHPDRNFIGMEGNESVLLRALEKADKEELQNLRFISGYLHEAEDIFATGELDGIYLNFSDPWPKERHAQRRLTHGNFLRAYGRVLRPGGHIEIKTDNDALYQFTMEEIDRLGLEIKEHTRDLHNTKLAAKEVMTEYETKFHDAGKNIYYIKL